MTKLAVIAGQGRIPVQIAEMAVSMGHDVVVMPICGQADADFSAYVSLPITLGAIGVTLALMQEQGCTHLVMGGTVVRPSLAALKPDASAVKLLGKAIMRGDDSLLRVISDFFATNGIETLAPDHFMPDRLTPAGLLAGTAPDATQKGDIALARRVLEALGGLDVGQAVVVQAGRVLAIEAAEGTNAMLRRAAGLIDESEIAAVMVKLPKSGQDRKLDMPVIGLATLESATAAGVGVIAVQAGGVLFAEAATELRKAAQTQGVTLLGLEG